MPYRLGEQGRAIQPAHSYLFPLQVFIRLQYFFQNHPKSLDPSYKTDLDLSDCFGMVNYFIAKLCKINQFDIISLGISLESSLGIPQT